MLPEMEAIYMAIRMSTGPLQQGLILIELF